MTRKIAILTSGGDAPGMNVAIRSVVKQALALGIEPFLIFEGYKGLVENKIFPAQNFNVDDYISRGGSFIYSARFPEFKKEEIRKLAKKNLSDQGIDSLIVIGGDGTYQGAQKLHELGIKTVCLPGTIDNDISSTDFTIGFDSALNTIVEAVDKIRDTSLSHARCYVVEIMGNLCGDLTLYAGFATGAEVVITPQNKMSPEEIATVVKKQTFEKNKRSVLILTTEHLYENLKNLAMEIEKISGVETRSSILGYIQRGGKPSAFERVLATFMGIKAVELIFEHKSGLAIGFKEGKIKYFPILEALSIDKKDHTKKITQVNKINQK